MSIGYKELCKVTKQRMIAEVKDKIARLEEEAIMFQLTCGMPVGVSPVLINCTAESSGRKRKMKVDEFQFPEKRKKPISVTDIL